MPTHLPDMSVNASDAVFWDEASDHYWPRIIFQQLPTMATGLSGIVPSHPEMIGRTGPYCGQIRLRREGRSAFSRALPASSSCRRASSDRRSHEVRLRNHTAFCSLGLLGAALDRCEAVILPVSFTVTSATGRAAMPAGCQAAGPAAGAWRGASSAAPARRRRRQAACRLDGVQNRRETQMI